MDEIVHFFSEIVVGVSVAVISACLVAVSKLLWKHNGMLHDHHARIKTLEER